jgi:hypothetical protein
MASAVARGCTGTCAASTNLICNVYILPAMMLVTTPELLEMHWQLRTRNACAGAVPLKTGARLPYMFLLIEDTSKSRAWTGMHAHFSVHICCHCSLLRI